MEESEARRERLKAMRVEASQAGVHNEIGNYVKPHHLSNPLIETSATPPVQMNSYATPRFDYYTDPMSAFSADKRRGKVSNQSSRDYFTPPRPRNPEMTPSPAHQVQTNSPDQRMYQARTPYYSSGPRNPEMTASPAHQVQTNYFPDQRMYQARGPYHSSGPYGSPIGMVGPYGTRQVTPGVWNGSAGTSSYYLPSNSSEVGNSSSPGFGGSPSINSGQGRGCCFSNSPSSGSGFGGSPTSNFGRGRGRWLGNSMRPGLRQGGRRGLGSHDSVSAELRPELYYDKSMVEDPWKLLKPVIWRREIISANSLNNTPDSIKFLHSNTSGMKKARISEASNESSSKPSLAEYLAAAFNEAVTDEATNDEPSL